MKIVEIEAILLSFQFPEGEAPAWIGGHIATWDAALVRVTSDNGLTGLGEVGQGTMAAEGVPGLVGALRPYVVGKSLEEPWLFGDYLRSVTAFWARTGIAMGVIGAVESACLDLVAKEQGVPMFELLGGSKHDSVEIYASSGLGLSVGEIVDRTLSEFEQGYRTVKVRAIGGVTGTIELIESISAVKPPGTQIAVDAVQGCASNPWGLESAVEVGRVAQAHDVRWFEEPCHVDDLELSSLIRAELEVPISGGESRTGWREFLDLMEADAVDIVQPDVSIVGGPALYRRIADEASRRGLRCYPHVWGSAVTVMMAAHTAFSTQSTEIIEMCTVENPLRSVLMVEPLRIIDGRLLPPESPGLGVHLDADILAEFPFIPGRGHVISS